MHPMTRFSEGLILLEKVAGETFGILSLNDKPRQRLGTDSNSVGEESARVAPLYLKQLSLPSLEAVFVPCILPLLPSQFLLCLLRLLSIYLYLFQTADIQQLYLIILGVPSNILWLAGNCPNVKG